MPSDLRPSSNTSSRKLPLPSPSLSKSISSPLLPNGAQNPPSPTYDSYESANANRNSSGHGIRPTISRRSTATLRDPEILAQQATRRRYTYAAFFLALSLISFCVQTETAVYIQRKLNWNKPYCMMYMTHGSWLILWPLEIAILKITKWNQPFPQFWRRHLQIVRQTALMVKYRTIHLESWQLQEGNRVFWGYMLRTTAFVTCVLTVAGSSWYVAARLTTPSDLTAIYHCSAFFAYVFSVPMLKERVKLSKVIAVGIAITGVFIMAYGGGSSSTPKHGNKSGGGAGGPDHDAPEPASDWSYRFLGNIIMGGGSVLYGFYEVLYKKVACPPDDTSPGRGVIFANAFGSMVGAFTVFVLWIPMPVLHYLGWEIFELPRGEQAYMMAISVLANVVFSGSFLVLISLTSPVLSSVAALLTIFMVAIIDQILPDKPEQLTVSTLLGGLLIIGAFVVLSYATYKEMTEEKRRRYSIGAPGESSEDDDDDDEAVIDDEPSRV